MHENSKDKKSKDKVLEVALARFKLAKEAEASNREKALDDLKFRAGEQWPENIKRERESEDRPCLVVNKVPSFVRQITNDQRQNRPSIKVYPVDDKADVETAKIFQGLIRHIQYNSNADLAYDTAFDGAVTKGIGYFRITPKYVNPTSFEQELIIERIRNSFTVYFDPSSKQPDGSDANWAFIVEDVPHEDYKSEYGNSELANSNDWESIGDSRPDWVTSETCRIAEYFYKEYEEVELVQLTDGTVHKLKDLPEDFDQDLISKRRKANIPTIKWLKINGMEILEETIFPGEYIPVFPVLGEELDVDGELRLSGIVRDAKDSQKMYNYYVSSEAENIGLAPKAPYIAAEGQITSQYRHQWENANKKNYSVLTYVPTSSGGQLIGPPQRSAFEPAVQAITNARMQASEDIKSTTGIYDASLGAMSNETSGIAIQRRNNQAQTSNFHFIDNLTRTLRHAGRVMVSVIPYYYDTARAERILGEDGTAEVVVLNQIFEKDGKQYFYDLSAGKYDVDVETGPSYATKRQEASASMIEITRAYPQIFGVAGDLMIGKMDWEGAREIAERLKKTIPPNLIQDGPAQLPPEAQAQMQQMSQMIEQLTNNLKEAQLKLDTKALEIESKERIEFAKIELDAAKALLKVDQEAARQELNQELYEVDQRQELLNYNKPVGYPDAASYNQNLTSEMPLGQPME